MSICFFTSEMLNTLGLGSSVVSPSRFFNKFTAKDEGEFSPLILGESLDFKLASLSAASFALEISIICFIYSCRFVC
jgi:hypothetical protein